MNEDIKQRLLTISKEMCFGEAASEIALTATIQGVPVKVSWVELLSLVNEYSEFKQYIDEVNEYVDQLQELAHEEDSECRLGDSVIEYAIRIVRKYHQLKRYLG